MVTQDVKLSNVEKVVKEKRVVTMENILLKANLKLGGLNYEIEMNGVLPSSDVKPTEQNIPPGVVVDKQLTHPSFKEFYLNSHITLQGSARTPRYTVLVDDLDLSMDELEGMTYMLTYDHQIVNLPTSLPTPLYVANRYAERGRNTYAAHLICSGSSSSDSGSSIDYGRLAHRLSYNNTKLCNIRVNA
ncbi:piwi domain protein [Teladorsagia circumcincta]|uniref:Piwi domain protein n=1 Tax=Teladorsagia circumcincta TaxID=45464 RepID=A0A2G9U233_TELCI|nr:piwi domain protein [Teladorsagia circumcincta]